MHKFLLPFFLLACTTLSFGQLDNHVFEDRRPIDPADSGKVFLGVNFLGFSKDNEYDNYDNPVITGYTLFGYQFNPFLSYNISRSLRIEGGIYFQKDFGNSKYTTIAPTFSIKYQRKNLSVIFGNLDGSLNHRLIEPLYDFERVLNNRLENGMQVQLMREDFFFDLWIDWRKMIYVNDPTQEQLVAGVNILKRVFRSGATELSIPVQALTRHYGGQINFKFSGAVETLLNSAVGLELKHTATGLIRETRFNGFYVYYKSISRDLLQPFQDGSGGYLNAAVSTKYGLNIMASYWYGHEFITLEGGKIYPSVSVFNYANQQPIMKLLILRFLYDIRIREGLYATARLEPYYDLNFKSFQTSYGVYLNFRDRFFLVKRK